LSTNPFAPLKIELRRASLVKTEPVFDLRAALQAAAQYEAAGWGLIAWEGWVAYPDGRYGHPNVILGTMPIEQKSAENWTECVHRSWEFGLETMKKEATRWPIPGHSSDQCLYFCLTTVEPPIRP
jgi:hypothetical protein